MAAEASNAKPGLTSAEAERRLRDVGPNAVPEREPPVILILLRKFWGPVPWMLEVTLALELALGRTTQSVIITLLLLLNAAISFAQEWRARNALKLLSGQLEVRSRVLRDSSWQVLPSATLVPGDVVHVRAGDFVPADLHLFDGAISLDQSTLTGETAPVDAGVGQVALAGTVVRQGEARGEVTATGSRTKFGKTVELVHTARAPSHLEHVVLGVVKYLIVLDIALAAAVLAYAAIRGHTLADVVTFALVLLIAAVPVALPATYTLAGAVGALVLSGRGVLVTRLPALEEAAAMDVLCCDKTGTLTENRLVFSDLHVCEPFREFELLRAAAWASDEATHDPLDLAILAEARRRGIETSPPGRKQFIPFDPSRKRSETLIQTADAEERYVKGAPPVVADLATGAPDLTAETDAFARSGCRVLAVAVGQSGPLQLAGLIALRDPPRGDSATVVKSLQDLGIRLVMVTGDSAATARVIAEQVGIRGVVCPAAEVRTAAGSLPADCGIVAGVYPEDKFHLVQAFQWAGHVVGMTGDGVNDAPALRQAELGVAVTDAVDAAKTAAGVVLTQPGLQGIVATIMAGREIYQRMLTYTLNKIVKTFLISLLLAGGLLLTGTFVTTPRHVLILLFINDFVTMSLAGDRVRLSGAPDRWNMRAIATIGFGVAGAWLALIAAAFLVARLALGLSLAQSQTLIFVMLVLTGYANVFLIRERRALWTSQPGRWLMATSVGGAIVAGFLAGRGVLMAALPVWLLPTLVTVVAGYLLLLDRLKVHFIRRLGLGNGK